MPHHKIGQKEFIAGANMGFRLCVLQELKGFAPNLRVAQDMDLILRARAKGYNVYFEPRALVTHDPDRATLTSIFKYASRHAASTILLRHQYRELLKTPLILQSPLLLFSLAPLIALKVTFQIYRRFSGVSKFLWTLPVVYALKIAWCWGASLSLWYGFSQNSSPVRENTSEVEIG
jgi:GT2 family glycosyltransferase